MAWLEDGQTAQVEMLDGIATAILLVRGNPAAEWRTEYNVRAAARPVSAQAWERLGRTVLRVDLPGPDPIPLDVRRALSEAVDEMLNPHVPEPVNPHPHYVRGRDHLETYRLLVAGWLGEYGHIN